MTRARVFHRFEEFVAINLVGAVQPAILRIQVTAVTREHLPEPWAKQWNGQNGGFRSMLFTSYFSQWCSAVATANIEDSENRLDALD